MADRRLGARGLVSVAAGLLLAGCAPRIAGTPTREQLDQMLQQYTRTTYHFFPERDRHHRYLVTVRLPSGRRYILTEYSCLWTTTGDRWLPRQQVLVFDETGRYMAAYLLSEEAAPEDQQEGAKPPNGPIDAQVPILPARQAGGPVAVTVPPGRGSY